MNTNDIDTTVPDTIAKHISGYGPLEAMLDVRYFITNTDSLSFTFRAKAANEANHLTITLEPNDTYRVDFDRVGVTMRSASRSKNIETVHNVYAEELRGLIEEKLQLRVSL